MRDRADQLPPYAYSEGAGADPPPLPLDIVCLSMIKHWELFLIAPVHVHNDWMKAVSFFSRFLFSRTLFPLFLLLLLLVVYRRYTAQ